MKLIVPAGALTKTVDGKGRLDLPAGTVGPIGDAGPAGPAGITGPAGAGLTAVRVAPGKGSIIIPGLRASLDAAPAVPNAFDDEFDGDLSAWTTLGTFDTLEAVNGCLHMKVQVPDAFRVFGVYKPMPTLPFTVTAHWQSFAFYQNYHMCAAIGFLENAGGGKIWNRAASVYVNGTNYVSSYAWNSRTGGRAGVADIGWGPTFNYLRMVVTSVSDVSSYGSYDGRCWFPIALNANVGSFVTFTQVGLVMATHDVGSNLLEAYVDWIRFS